MKTPLDIDDEFEAFMRKAYGYVNGRQYRESRRVFFAGAALIYYHIVSLAELPDNVGIIELAQLGDQLIGFNKQVEEDKD